MLARSITLPLQQLSRVAEEMSKGNLNASVNVKAKDEVQVLASSLDKMRVTLKGAIVRLEEDWARREAQHAHFLRPDQDSGPMMAEERLPKSI
jgi:methyl-accepting chemotaxis protein